MVDKKNSLHSCLGYQVTCASPCNLLNKIYEYPSFNMMYKTVLLLASCAGDDGDPRFDRPSDLDLIQSVPPVDLLNMKAPPRVLTLTEQPLDSLETDQTSSTQNNPSQVVRAKLKYCVVFVFDYCELNSLNYLNLPLSPVVVHYCTNLCITK